MIPFNICGNFLNWIYWFRFFSRSGYLKLRPFEEAGAAQLENRIGRSILSILDRLPNIKIGGVLQRDLLFSSLPNPA